MIDPDAPVADSEGRGPWPDGPDEPPPDFMPPPDLMTAFLELVGLPVPSFSLRTVDGRSLSDDALRGRVVLLDFWASWCEPCHAASPVMQALHERWGDRGLAVVGVHCMDVDDAGEPVDAPDAARAYAADHGYTFTFAYGGDAACEACHVRSIPAFIVVDRAGVVRNADFGLFEELEDELEAAIAPLVAEAAGGG